MRLVKIFALIAFIILLLMFFLKNNQPVAIDLVFKQYDQLSVSFVMLGALTLGILIGYGATLMTVWTLRAENRAMRKKIKEMGEELNDLRNVAIDEELSEGEEGE
ncbi:MAG: LapA family protein [Candidatus Neomarinimicrobiota bacterium]|nr:MAG: LapA family protein [Candidatus Neomarinimicrobiota bacterium]